MLEITAPAVMSTLLINFRLVTDEKVHEMSDIDLERVKVTPKIIGKIKYFAIEGLSYSFAYVAHLGVGTNKPIVYLFKSKQNMVNMIDSLLRGNNIVGNNGVLGLEIED